MDIRMFFDSNQNAIIFLASLVLLFALFFAAKKVQKIKKVFIVTTVLYNLIYLVWRVVFTLPLSYGIVSVVLSILLLTAEWMGFWQSMVFRFLFWKPFHRYAFPPHDFAIQPSVDVFVATYNENMQILRRTLTGCLNLQYSGESLHIYLCDDGRRQEAKDLCTELGVHYLTRPDNKHAKAGNINHALSCTDGEFIMLLDADMAPKSDFLKKTIGYFTDEKVGFLQTPQVFYNPDPFQYNLRLNEQIPNEQDFFMLDIQAGRATYNAVLHVGTNAIFRRKAIEEIGGIPTGTITEDMATGMLIQAKGYTSVFVKEVLCTGLSVENFRDLIRQRERWCRGNIQVTKKWNPLRLKGLTFAQRLIYTDGFIYWFFGVQKMIYILCPILYLLFGTVILNASMTDLFVFWLPSFLASVLTFRAMSQKTRSIAWSHIYEVALAPYIALAALSEAIFSKPIPFKVTPKGTNSQKTTFSIRLAIPHLLLAVLTIIGWVRTGWLYFSGMLVTQAALINILWSIYNMVAISISIFACIERPRKRIAERLCIEEPVQIQMDETKEAFECKLVNISETGMQVECAENVPLDAGKERIHLTSDKFGSVEGEVVWVKFGNRKKEIGIRFLDQTPESYQKLMQYICDYSMGYHKVH